MTLTQSYGPAPTATREPLVVPIDVTRGWQAADTVRRVAALLAVPVALLVALAAPSGLSETALLGWLLVGPATFYSLARVLRPEPRSPERTPRHLLSAAATALAVPTTACLLAPSGSDDVIMLCGVPAFLIGVVTVVWGLVALAARACLRR